MKQRLFDTRFFLRAACQMLVLHHVLDMEFHHSHRFDQNRKSAGNTWFGSHFYGSGAPGGPGACDQLRPASPAWHKYPTDSFLLSLISQGRRDVPEKNVFYRKKHFSYYHRIRPGAGLKKSFFQKVFLLSKEFLFSTKRINFPRFAKNRNTFMNQAVHIP